MAVTDGYFSWLSSFEGAKGGEPPKKFESFFTLSCQITIALKPEKNNHVLYAKYCTIIISTRGEPPQKIVGIKLSWVVVSCPKIFFDKKISRINPEN